MHYDGLIARFSSFLGLRPCSPVPLVLSPLKAPPPLSGRVTLECFCEVPLYKFSTQLSVDTSSTKRLSLQYGLLEVGEYCRRFDDKQQLHFEEYLRYYVTDYENCVIGVQVWIFA